MTSPAVACIDRALAACGLPSPVAEPEAFRDDAIVGEEPRRSISYVLYKTIYFSLEKQLIGKKLPQCEKRFSAMEKFLLLRAK